MIGVTLLKASAVVASIIVVVFMVASTRYDEGASDEDVDRAAGVVAGGCIVWVVLVIAGTVTWLVGV